MRTLKTLFIGILALLFVDNKVQASHIVGGRIYYTYISQNKYVVKLEYYKDCSPAAIDFPPGDLRIGIYGKTTNTLVRSIDLKPGPIIPVDFLIGNCISSPVSCVQKRVYTLEIDTALFKDQMGYYLNYEQCCRNFSIKNVKNPDNSGIAYYSDFPALIQDGQAFINSSPNLFTEQNLYLCAGEDFYSNFSHIDPDGDSLAYRLIPPLKGFTDNANNNGNGITILNPGPYAEIDWNTGYSMNNIMDGNPDITIDSITGMIHVKPQQAGLYSFAIGVDEYRNGKFIAEVRHEIQYQVILCPVRKNPEINWLNPNENKVKANDQICLEFNANDLNTSDTLSIALLELTGELSRHQVSLIYDTTQTNPIQFNVCIKTNCDLLDKENEGFKLVVNDHSCPDPKTDTILVQLDIETYDLADPFKHIPNVFSPNGDGINDYFYVNTTYPAECIDDFFINIYNRWGEQVFESKNLNFKWFGDGLPTGVYFYVIKLGDKEKAGSISIMF